MSSVGVAGIVQADDAAASANTSHHLDNANKPTTGNLTLTMPQLKSKMTTSRREATMAASFGGGLERPIKPQLGARPRGSAVDFHLP